ncbi:hypothetical protein PspLS_05859 [Pyricularia sp. CBS 133598]|nr:hypothetical protein PspLS_05859 [Pyricularia sp. CBS 133598]
MEIASRRHFFKHGGQDPSIGLNSAEIQECHWCQLRSFANHEKYPISIINNTDDGASLPADFRFISERILGEGVSRAEASFLSGCECTSNEDCMYGGCECLSDLPDSGLESDNDADSRKIRNNRIKKFAYYSSGERAGLLRESYLDTRTAIYECHEQCSCGPDCPNRVIERGRTLPLQIFRTDNGRGWGVKATVDIKCGQFVDTYIGEVITDSEAVKRRKATRKKDFYLFDLDKFWEVIQDDESRLVIDGEYRSGPSRFFNHSCDPNMRIFARVGAHAELNLHELAFFAIRDIANGEELTFDYVDGQVLPDDESLGNDYTKCLCESPNCRGFLWS